jgi:NADPH:quinone reductase-like Zn-dependent oxidoreductase
MENTMKYKSILVTRRGGLDAIRIAENELRQPEAGEARIRVLATPVCQDDIAIRVGNRPFLKKLPYVPGYAFIGEVDALGEGVMDFAIGDRVGALTQYNSHSEVVYWPANELVSVPQSIDPAEATTLILNYLVAYQVMHRVVQAIEGDKVLVIGASGGVGTAFLQLGQLAGLKMYGLASPGKHSILRSYGAIPIDYHTQDFVEQIRQAEPQGIKYVFNGMGQEYFESGLKVLKKGGVLVAYGAPQSLSQFGLLVVKLLLYNALPNGKSISGYGTHRLGVDLFKTDWSTLFNLLEQGKIKPIVAQKFPLLEATRAYNLLESGQVTGNLVLVSPALTEGAPHG